MPPREGEIDCASLEARFQEIVEVCRKRGITIDRNIDLSAIRPRGAPIEPRPGRSLIEANYSQIEQRMAACLLVDPPYALAPSVFDQSQTGRCVPGGRAIRFHADLVVRLQRQTAPREPLNFTMVVNRPSTNPCGEMSFPCEEVESGDTVRVSGSAHHDGDYVVTATDGTTLSMDIETEILDKKLFAALGVPEVFLKNETPRKKSVYEWLRKPGV